VLRTEMIPSVAAAVACSRWPALLLAPRCVAVGTTPNQPVALGD
jgi:hypothetical protein